MIVFQSLAAFFRVKNTVVRTLGFRLRLRLRPDRSLPATTQLSAAYCLCTQFNFCRFIWVQGSGFRGSGFWVPCWL